MLKKNVFVLVTINGLRRDFKKDFLRLLALSCAYDLEQSNQLQSGLLIHHDSHHDSHCNAAEFRHYDLRLSTTANRYHHTLSIMVIGIDNLYTLLHTLSAYIWPVWTDGPRLRQLRYTLWYKRNLDIPRTASIVRCFHKYWSEFSLVGGEDVSDWRSSELGYHKGEYVATARDVANDMRVNYNKGLECWSSLSFTNARSHVLEAYNISGSHKVEDMLQDEGDLFQTVCAFFRLTCCITLAGIYIHTSSLLDHDNPDATRMLKFALGWARMVDEENGWLLENREWCKLRMTAQLHVSIAAAELGNPNTSITAYEKAISMSEESEGFDVLAFLEQIRNATFKLEIPGEIDAIIVRLRGAVEKDSE